MTEQKGKEGAHRLSTYDEKQSGMEDNSNTYIIGRGHNTHTHSPTATTPVQLRRAIRVIQAYVRKNMEKRGERITREQDNRQNAYNECTHSIVSPVHQWFVDLYLLLYSLLPHSTSSSFFFNSVPPCLLLLLLCSVNDNPDTFHPPPSSLLPSRFMPDASDGR